MVNPNSFRRGPGPFQEMNEVAVGADQRGKPRPASPIENERIRRADKAVIIATLQARDNVGQASNQFRGEVLVERTRTSFTARRAVRHVWREGLHGRAV